MIIVFPVFSQLRFFVQDVQKSIGSIPEILAQMIKESTDFLAKNFEKRNADLKMELLKYLNDALGRVYDMFSRIFRVKDLQFWYTKHYLIINLFPQMHKTEKKCLS